MAINYELLNKGGISLGTNFELLSEKPLDSRLVVPSLAGLQNYIDNAAAYEGMIVYVSDVKKHYEVKVIEGALSYREFGLTSEELNEIITNATTAAMEFKGATATLPSNPTKGDMYKVAGENISIKIDDVDAKLGDSIVYDGAKWFLIPSGDDIEDTWRPVDGVNSDATLKFVDGDKTKAAVAADGTIKYNHETIAAPTDVTADGDEKTRTYITAVETDGYGHITGYKTATENVEDTNTEYTFESQVESSSVYFNVKPSTEGATEQTICVDAYSKNEANDKFVAKETGKSLVSDTEIARLAEVDNYDDEEVRGLIDDLEDAVSKKVEQSAYDTKIAALEREDATFSQRLATFTGTINQAKEDAIRTAAADASSKAQSALDTATSLITGKLVDVNAKIGTLEGDVDGLQNALDGKSDDGHTHTKSEITDFAHTHTVDDVTDFDEKVKAYGYATTTELGVVNTALNEHLAIYEEDSSFIAEQLGSVDNRIDVAFGKYQTDDYAVMRAAKDNKGNVIVDTYETKENVQKVIDSLGAYVEANDRALAGVKETAEAATTVSEVDAQIDTKITALKLGETYEPVGAENRAIAAAKAETENQV
jgi:hypothetical protein